MLKIKLHIGQLISIALLAVVLLPFAVQFTHILEKHEHSVCNAQNIVHIDQHEIDCSVFHYKINTNNILFASVVFQVGIDTNEVKIYSNKDQISSVKLCFKSSRAPPVLLS
ncbi:hypothetical protein [Lutibacter sp.]|uniref:hypothetical protein n=1 Tax=Lutibacter sp. TaxID=1925666 RepID=UPI0027345AEC|nr:hypothetical protein [Lutibacter sp.]MDP3312806.1 hypothetical protein [Lutibacter sp.]